MMRQPPPRPDLGWSAPPLAPEIEAHAGRHGMHGGPPVGWSIWEAVGIFVSGYVLQLVVAIIVFVAIGAEQVSTTGAAGMPELAATLAGDIAIVGMIVVWLSIRHPGWVRALRLPEKGKRLREVAIGVGMGPAVYLGTAVVVALTFSIVLGAISGQEATAPEQIDSDSLSTAGQVLTVIVAVVVAPITEELLFRGLVFRSLRDRHGFWLGALVSSAIFGLVHYLPAPWPDTLLLMSTLAVTGFALAAIYEWRGNLVSCIVTHMSFNAVGVTFILWPLLTG